MDFARQQRDPTRHVVGIAFVILFHLLVIYALLTGLGSRAIQMIKKPLNATIIEEIKAPPPPPPPPLKKIVEPPKIKMEQPYVPPPDIPVVTPPPVAPVIAAVTQAPPTEPVVIAPPAVEAPPAPKPAIRQGVSCKDMEKPSFPREAIRAGVQKGRVVAVLAINAQGSVTGVDIESADPPRVFDRIVRDTLSSWKCASDSAGYKARVEVNFSLTD